MATVADVRASPTPDSRRSDEPSAEPSAESLDSGKAEYVGTELNAMKPTVMTTKETR